MVSPTSVVVATQHQVSCELGGESVILGLTRGVYYGLGPVGTTIWGLLRTPRQVGEIRDAITSAFDVEAGQCERDLVTFLNELADEGLIDVSHGLDS
jgi:hypothetical protein